MKRLMIAAMLMGSATAFAQPPQGGTMTQPMPGTQPAQPDPTATPPADPMPPEGGPETTPPVTPGPNPEGTAPPTTQMPMTPPPAPMPMAAPPAPAATERQQYSYGTLPPPRPADETYRRCSRTVTDNCVQGGPR